MPGRILLAVDDSRYAPKTADIVERLARQTDAEVTVLHVHEIALGEWGRIQLDSPSGDESARTIAGRLTDAGLHATVMTRESAPRSVAQEILAVADQIDADVIAVGSRGMTDLGSLAFGSVSHKLLHLSRRPVLVVPAR